MMRCGNTVSNQQIIDVNESSGKEDKLSQELDINIPLQWEGNDFFCDRSRKASVTVKKQIKQL
jgi:hypothetical protein